MSAKILVVDDIAPNVRLLEAKLKREYFNVITAMNGEEALQKVRDETPDVVLLDIMMPGMDGFEVCQRLKADPKTMHIPVVMVTALTDVADRVRGLEVGADDFLSKPVNDMALFSRIRSLVRLKMTIDEWRLREQTANQFGVLGQDALIMNESVDNADILLIEDNATDAQSVVETLRRDGHRVTVVSSGARAIEKAETTAFELLIVSLTLKDEDGLRLCSHLRMNDMTKKVPTLMLAEEADMPRIVTGMEFSGAYDYIIRPIDKNELRARVHTQVRRRRYQERLQRNYEASLSLALTDSLTGLFNRRYLMAHMKKTMQEAVTAKKPLCVLMFDIDYFKSVNDTYGHGVGDEVLREFAERLTRGTRSFDLISRLGGEEFIVVLANVRRDIAFQVAYRLRKMIEEVPFKISSAEGELSVTTSIGGIILEEDDDMQLDIQDVLDRVDKCLYAAKEAGRNCIYFEGLGLVSASNVTSLG